MQAEVIPGGSFLDYPLAVTLLDPFDVALASPSVTVVPTGSTQTDVVTITRKKGFTGAIALSAAANGNAPAGLHVAAVDDLHGTRVTASADGMVPAGSYAFTVSARAGNHAETVSLAVQVSNFAVRLSPAAVTVVRGFGANVAVTLERAPSVVGQIIAFTLDGYSQFSFNPSSTTGSSTTLTLSSDFTLAPGTYDATVRALKAGLPPVTVASAPLTITLR